MISLEATPERWVNRLLLLGALVALYFTSWVHYLLFHSLAEIFSIIVAGTIFVIAINAHAYQANRYLLFIGIGYLFIGLLDLLHTLSYKGMNIFTDYDYYANQLWIATRYLESLTLLVGFIFLKRPEWFRISPVSWVYLGLTTLTIQSIFVWKIFPVCFIEGVGLTPFKIYSEYLISTLLALSIILLVRHRGEFPGRIFHYMIWALLCTIGSELAFTFYISNYGFSNLVGHYLKIISFYLVYKALVETGIRQPYALIFRELKDNEEKLRRLSTIDPLTKLKNRRAFLELFEHQKRRGDRLDLVNSLILGDIDFFKKINDSFGHECGDLVLKSVAGTMLQQLREQDVVCRWGGEEFLILLPACNGPEAVAIAEKLRQRISSNKISCGKRNIPLTISFGVTEHRGKEPIDETLRRADQSLYRAKAQGRNQVIGDTTPKTPFC